MSELERLSFSIERDLRRRFDELVANSRYENRSEFLRDLIRERMVQRQWDRNSEVIGTLTLVFDHEQRELGRKLTRLQHRHHHEILAATHIHLDERLCAEMIMMRGRAERINRIADALKRQKGVLHAALSMSTTGKRL